MDTRIQYNFTKCSDIQEKLDSIFGFVFDKATEQTQFDNLQELDYTYNSLVNIEKKDEKQQGIRVPDSSSSFTKTPNTLADGS